jgi:glycosyltransferase involved in cell wall biosynthesis
MKIAFLNTDDFTGGAAIASLRLAQTIIEKGHDVTYFCVNKKSNHKFVKPIDNGFFFDLNYKFKFALERLFFSLYRKNKEVGFAFSPANTGFDLTKKINLKSFDLIHIHWTNFGFLSISDLEKVFSLNIPIVFTLHDMWLFTGGCHHSGDCLNFKESCGNCKQYLKKPSDFDLSFHVLVKKKKVFSKLNNLNIVGCSQWITQRSQASSLLSKFTHFSIPNPLDKSLFYPKNKSTARQNLRLDSNKTYLLFVAMKVSVIWKGFYLLEESLNELKKTHSNNESKDIELLVVGQANPLDFESFPFKIHLLGHIKDTELMNDIYNASDVFVTSSIQENLPNTIMESMATGTPCVGFNVGGIPEMIEHKKTGYLATYKSAPDLAKGINWVINESIIEELKTNCVEKVKSEFEKEVVATKYLEVYKSLTSNTKL